MPKIPVTMIDRIVGSTISADGDHMLLQLRTTEGSDMALALECNQIGELIDHCAQAGTESQRIVHAGPDSSAMVNWWNSAIDRASRQFTLMLTFGRGGTLSFDFSEHMARALLGTLHTLYGREPTRVTAETADIGFR